MSIKTTWLYILMIYRCPNKNMIGKFHTFCVIAQVPCACITLHPLLVFFRSRNFDFTFSWAKQLSGKVLDNTGLLCGLCPPEYWSYWQNSFTVASAPPKGWWGCELKKKLSHFPRVALTNVLNRSTVAQTNVLNRATVALTSSSLNK